MSNLAELLTQHVQKQPERIAVGTSDLRVIVTYRQLDALVRSVMEQLSSSGLKRGDAVALLSDTGIEYVVGLLAMVRLGARVAPVNPALSSTELGTRLLQLSAHGMLVARQLANKLELVENVAESVPRWIMQIEGPGACEVQIVDGKGRRPAPAAPLEANISIDREDVALLMFTGGTTGPAKLVALTHGNVAASIENICFGYALSPSDATLLVMPLFHGHGLIAGLLSTLASGGSAYLPSTGAFSAHLFWPDVVRLGVTWYTAVPTIHRILLCRASKEYPSSSPAALRFIRSCSAPLDEELAARPQPPSGPL